VFRAHVHICNADATRLDWINSKRVQFSDFRPKSVGSCRQYCSHRCPVAWLGVVTGLLTIENSRIWLLSQSISYSHNRRQSSDRWTISVCNQHRNQLSFPSSRNR